MKKKATGLLVKGLSIEADLYRRVCVKAKTERRSFSAMVRIAIERDLADPKVTANSSEPDDMIDTNEVAKMLKITPQTVQRRQRKPHDPLRKARSLLANKKPMQFYRSKIVELERKCA